MWFSSDSEQARAYDQVTTGSHTAKFSHEAIAAAASYEAAKAYENHIKAHGEPATHAKAVELLAAFTGGFIDRIAETKGLDTFDRERAKRLAHERAKEAWEKSGAY